jgi:cysteinyl-tRNA synthetase
LENRYRSQMDLSWSSINAAFATLQRWREKYQEWRLRGSDLTTNAAIRVAAILDDFLADLDTPQAMLKLRSVERDESLSDGEKAAIFEETEALFGLKLLELFGQQDLPPEAQKLLDMRALARTAKNFAESDELRNQLIKLGIEVRDTSQGQTWSWIIK